MERHAHKPAKTACVVDKVPTFEHALGIFAYHIGEIMTRRPENRVCVHFYGNVSGEYSFMQDGGESGPGGDTCKDHNGVNMGCRSAARNDYTARCMPVLAAIAAGTYVTE